VNGLFAKCTRETRLRFNICDLIAQECTKKEFYHQKLGPRCWNSECYTRYLRAWRDKATTYLLCWFPAFIMFNFVFCPFYLRSSCSNSLPLLVILVPDELCILPSSFRMNPLRVCEGLLLPSKGRGYLYFNTRAHIKVFGFGARPGTTLRWPTMLAPLSIAPLNSAAKVLR
jgi:hypothetical protein